MQIALITDTHLAAAAPAFRENIDAVRAWIARTKPDLTVHLGDITVDGSKHPEQLSYARDAFAAWPSELRFVPGNHDIGDNIDPHHHSAHDVRVNASRLAYYHQAFGADRWSFEAEGWTIVGLNALLFGADSEEERAQFSWLDTVLARATGPLGLMLHKPLFRNGPADTERHHRYLPIPPRLALSDRLQSKDLRFVLCGHTHQLRRVVIEGVEHVWAPSTAFIIPDMMQERIGEKIVGAMQLTLEPGSYSLDYVQIPGAAGHSIGDFRELYPQLG